MQYFDILAFHHSLQQFFTSFTFWWIWSPFFTFRFHIPYFVIFIENLGNYTTYCTKALTGMMMMVKTKWLQLSTKENEFELWFLAQGDCLQRSRGESRIEPPSFHHPGAFVFSYHFIIYYHYSFIMTKYLVVKASKHSPPRSIVIQLQCVNCP